MSTPGRKRVQPILIEDDDDTESNHTEPLISSLSSVSNDNTEDITPSLPAPTPTSDQSSLFDIKPSIKKTIYVALNFDELSHIRNVQTNSEFSTLLYDFQLYKTVVNGHICFSCRKLKFNFFNPGYRCTICLQRICLKCQRKITNRHDKICFVSLNLLRRSSLTTTAKSLTNDMTIERTDSESSSTTNKYKKYEKTKLSKNSFICCMDCFILFDPTTLV